MGGLASLTDEQCRTAFDAVSRTGSITAAAKAQGIPRSTLLGHYREAIRRGMTSPASAGPFTVSPLPSADQSIDDLIARRLEESQRVIAAAEARRIIPVTISTPGPIGLLVFGDPHIDSAGCDFARLKHDIEVAKSRPEYVFACNIGDLQDNWTGRLARLYAHSSVSHRDAWRLVEWMMREIRWLFLIRGNHDCWSGAGDPLDWIMRGSGAVDERHGARIALRHPCGAETRVHARHDFKGSSIYNDLHSHQRELREGHRDHILVAGHRHIGGDAGVVNPDGVVSQLVRVSGYKLVDDYARQGGFQSRPIHPSALIVIDPSKAESDRARVWVAPSVDEGAEYLDWKRARYDGKPRVRVASR